MSGVKRDADKARLELYPPEALFATARVLTFGAKKYSDRNWEGGIKFSRVFGALMRHLWAWWMGADCDPETGENHLHHAACCLAFLQTYVERDMVAWDDRAEAPKPVEAGAALRRPAPRAHRVREMLTAIQYWI